MFLPALALALTLGANPPVVKARALASLGSWDELYLALSSANPATYGSSDRKLLAALLNKGCAGLESTDAVLAFSLSEKSVAFQPTAEALLCMARTGQKTQQRGAAEEALRKGLATFPKNGSFGLALGKQLLEDHDAKGALAALKAVPKKSPQFVDARGLIDRAAAESMGDSQATAQAKSLEQKWAQGTVVPARASKSPTASPAGPGSLTYESGVGPGDVRTRTNSRFSMKYFNNRRDFGQRAEYEGKVAAALDEAYMASREFLGKTREQACDVVLYSKEEFALHFGRGMAQRVAGLYAQDAMRINGAEELSHQSIAVLVHEYVHAVVDEVSGFHAEHIPIWLNEGLAEYVEWRYLGNDGPAPREAAALQQAAKADRLPPLALLAHTTLVNTPNPPMTYAYSAMAVKRLLSNGGPSKLLDLIHDAGTGQPFEPLLVDRYGRDLNGLQSDVATDVGR